MQNIVSMALEKITGIYNMKAFALTTVLFAILFAVVPTSTASAQINQQSDSLFAVQIEDSVKTLAESAKKIDAKIFRGRYYHLIGTPRPDSVMLFLYWPNGKGSYVDAIKFGKDHDLICVDIMSMLGGLEAALQRHTPSFDINFDLSDSTYKFIGTKSKPSKGGQADFVIWGNRLSFGYMPQESLGAKDCWFAFIKRIKRQI